MLMPPDIGVLPGSPIGPLLTREQLRVAFEGGGYRCTSFDRPEAHVVAAGCGVDLQFGDVLETNGCSASLTVRSVVRINGSLEGRAARSGWRVRKSFSVTGPEPFRILLEMDVLFGADLPVADTLLHFGSVYGHLQTLLADAADILKETMVTGAFEADARAPVIRLEARFLGNLAVGRSGLVKQAVRRAPSFCLSWPSARERYMMLSACQRLKSEIMPELMTAMRRAALQLRAPQARAVSSQTLRIHARRVANADRDTTQTGDGSDTAVVLHRETSQ